MHIYVNDEPVNIGKEEICISELIELRRMPMGGTAVAVNDRLIPKSRHEEYYLHEGDRVILISAAFGG